MNARDRIEAYVVPGTVASFELLGKQIEGQRSIVGIQREEKRLPEIGEVYRLIDPDTNNEQYVRLTKVEHRVETFTYEFSAGSYVDFNRRRVDMEISSALTVTFQGGIPTPSGTTEPKSSVQDTQVADASRYYGIQSTSADISQGDLTVKVNSVYAPLVPSARVESPVLDQYGGYTAKRMVATASTTRSVSPKFVHINNNQSRSFLQTGALPGTVSLTIEGGTFEEDRKGSLTHSSGANNFSKLTIDYENGELNVWRTSSYTTTTAGATYNSTLKFFPDRMNEYLNF